MKKLLFILVLMTSWAFSAMAQDVVAQDTASTASASQSSPGVENKIEEALDEVAEETDEHKFDIKETIFEHLGDGYGWEVPFNHHKRIPLPVIVWGKDGLHIFSSSRVTHGEEYVDGDATFKIATEGDYKGKLVEIVDGKEYKPWDFSITKNVCAIFIACIIVALLLLQLARWHKKNPFKAPRKMTGAIEALVEFIYAGVIKPTLKEKSAKFAPYLLTVFFFIFFMNLLGLIVVFPGGANVTGNIAVTMVLAIMTFVMTNFFGTKVYWKEIFWPNAPIFLKLPLPIMPFVEFFGILTKPFALMIRLFANIMAGHTIILALTCLIFITASMGTAINGTMTIVSVLFTVFMNCLELLVACLQAYIFTLLSANYIGLAKVRE